MMQQLVAERRERERQYRRTHAPPAEDDDWLGVNTLPALAESLWDEKHDPWSTGGAGSMGWPPVSTPAGEAASFLTRLRELPLPQQPAAEEPTKRTGDFKFNPQAAPFAPYKDPSILMSFPPPSRSPPPQPSLLDGHLLAVCSYLSVSNAFCRRRG